MTNVQLLRSDDTFIWTECFGCGPIAAVLCESFLTHYGSDGLKLHCFGEPDDLAALPSDDRLVPMSDPAGERRRFPWRSSISSAYRAGHQGTALLWARILQSRPERFLVHVDSDVILTGRALDAIGASLAAGAALVGPRRCYQRNPHGFEYSADVPDVVGTSSFALDSTLIPRMPERKLARMIYGADRWSSVKPIIDFFDPISFLIIDKGGVVDYLDPISVGGVAETGVRSQEWTPLNDLPLRRKLDVGRDLVHFSAVGSGMACYLDRDGTLTLEPSYREYALHMYAIFEMALNNRDIGIDLAAYGPILDYLREVRRTGFRAAST